AIHPASQREVDAMVRKLDDVAAQLVTATALHEAARRATAGDLDGALARLDQLGDAGQRNARALRQRAIVLLRLERYVEADAVVDALRDLPDAVAREFATRYPGLRVRQQIATAGALVRARDFERARSILALATTTAPDQQLELAYCKACCAAAEGYRKHEGGDRGGAARLLFEALAHVEGVLEDARRAGHDRLVELHGKLETDVAAAEGRGA
ncbi:MAG: hypothetical protein NT062_31150, partial [Proteobacteria bacterium]|nr:hypothetical protein [Pseudomonadota bacterium]